MKPVPVMVTLVPPVYGPVVGLTWVTAGAFGVVKFRVFEAEVTVAVAVLVSSTLTDSDVTVENSAGEANLSCVFVFELGVMSTFPTSTEVV